MTTDTLGKDAEFPCSSKVDRLLDDCLEDVIPMELDNEFNCSVPYLPAPEEIPTCNPDLKEAMTKFEFLSSSGQEGLCGKPCKTMDVFTGTYSPIQ